MLKIDINILFTVINLVVLVLAMKVFLFKPIHKVLAQRQKIVDDNLADAAASKESAAEMAQKHRESLAGIEDEKTTIIKDARKLAAAEGEKLLTDAQEKAESIISDAKAEAELKAKEMMNQAQSEISAVVLSAVAKLMLKKHAAGIDEGLYDEFLTKAGEEDHD